MSPQELVFKAQKIAQDFVASGSDMNSAIANLALTSKLNDEQINRLIEEANKACFLINLEKSGKQTFDVCSFEKVKESMKPVEKTAMQSYMPIEKVDPVLEALNSFRSENGLEKVASEVHDFTELQKLAVEAHEAITDYVEIVKLAADYEIAGKKKYGNVYSGEGLVKVAEKHSDKYIVKLGEILEEMPRFESDASKSVLNLLNHPDCQSFFDKEAGFAMGNINPLKSGISLGERAGSLINLAVGAPIGLVAKGAGKAASGAVKAGIGAATIALPATAILGKSPINRVFNGMMLKHEGSKAVEHAHAHGILGTNMVGPSAELFSKAASEVEKVAFLGALLPTIARVAGPMLGKVAPMAGKLLGGAGVVGEIGGTLMNAMPSAGGIIKGAGWREGLQHALDFVIPGATMGWAGITATAAKKLGGGIALTMNQRDFDESFDTIIKRNPELADRAPQVREYFNIITQNAPSLAKNPLVAGSLVKNMDALGGVDFNTVKMMRETERLHGGGSDSKGLSDVSPFHFS